MVRSTGVLYETTCRLLSRKSITLRPLGSSTKASRMFHSRGTVQSSTSVPEGTWWSSTPISRRSTSSVARRPSPVMLRHSG
jgi:hypothetical protein